LLRGIRGVYLIPYTTRFHELQFFIVYGNTKKKKKKLMIVFDILCPHILNIVRTTEQLNLNSVKLFLDGDTKIHGGAEITQGP